MNGRNRSIATFTRRKALPLGAGAAAIAAGLSRGPRRAVVRIDVTQGNVQPLPIALPDFVGGTPADGEMARNVTGVITNNLRRVGLVRADRSGGVHRTHHQSRRGAALPRLAPDQRAGAGDRRVSRARMTDG